MTSGSRTSVLRRGGLALGLTVAVLSSTLVVNGLVPGLEAIAGASSKPGVDVSPRVSHIAGLTGIFADGRDLFALGGARITELDAATGNVVRVISGPEYHFEPYLMVADGLDVFVMSSNGHSSWLTEINVATGALVGVFSGTQYDLNCPAAMVTDGPALFIADQCGLDATAGLSGSVVEFNTTTHEVVRVLTDAKYHFSGSPDAIVVRGPNLFIESLSSLAEVDGSSGVLTKSIFGTRYHFNDQGNGMAADGPDLFVVDSVGQYGAIPSVTEVDMASGALVRVIAGPRYHFTMDDQGGTILPDGPDLLVVGYNGVTEIGSANGNLVKYTPEGANRAWPSTGFGPSPHTTVLWHHHLFVANTNNNELIDLSMG